MERSKDWLDVALGDLEHAKHDLESGYYNWVCFPTQQTVKNTRSRRLEPHVYSLSEYEHVKSIVNEMIKDSIVIFQRKDLSSNHSR
ncbi:MAG: HEPN domain-containing protein [Thermosphaera sp.]